MTQFSEGPTPSFNKGGGGDGGKGGSNYDNCITELKVFMLGGVGSFFKRLSAKVE